MFPPPGTSRLGPHWATIGLTLVIRAANLANPAHLCGSFGISKLSGRSFFRFFCGFDNLQTPEIIEKSLENTGFYTIFIFLMKMLPNQKFVATGRSGTL